MSGEHTPYQWRFDEDGEVRSYDENGDLQANIALVYDEEDGNVLAAAPLLLKELAAVECAASVDREEGGFEPGCPCCGSARRYGHHEVCSLVNVLLIARGDAF